jgi:hypothetical protein
MLRGTANDQIRYRRGTQSRLRAARARYEDGLVPVNCRKHRPHERSGTTLVSIPIVDVRDGGRSATPATTRACARLRDECRELVAAPARALLPAHGRAHAPLAARSQSP